MTRGQLWVPWFNTTLRPQWRKAYGQRQRCTCFQNTSLFSGQIISIHICSHMPRSQGFPFVFRWPSASATKAFDFPLCGVVSFFHFFFPWVMRLGPRLLFPTRAIRCRDAEKLTSSFLQAPAPLSDSSRLGQFLAFSERQADHFFPAKSDKSGKPLVKSCWEPLGDIRQPSRSQWKQMTGFKSVKIYVLVCQI